jgi:hypothetical protein
MVRHRPYTAVILILACVQIARAQDEGKADSAGAGPIRHTIAATAVGGFLAGSLIMSYNDWWKGAGEPFHFTREGFVDDYSLGIDKLGHAYTGFMYFHAINDILVWGGYSRDVAFWWGGGCSMFFLTAVEVGDGISPYGFSWEDFAADAIGVGYGMLQEKHPFFRNIDFKWSFVPTDGWRWPPHFSDHYDAHTYWLAFNMHALLPGSVGDAWPAWLQPAVGYGVARGESRRELVIGLDLNLNAFSSDNRDCELARAVVSHIHLPMPAVKMTEGEKPAWYLFHRN